MEKVLITHLLSLLFVAPLIIMATNRHDVKWEQLLCFTAFFLLYGVLLYLPTKAPVFRLITSDWNWSGKIYAITGSLLFYFLFKKTFVPHDYIKIKQSVKTFRIPLSVISIMFIALTAYAFFQGGKTPAGTETLLFQATLPGLDEELAFRGIMLGLLSNALSEKLQFGPLTLGNPALLITSILFGLGHSFHLDTDRHLQQYWFEFFQTFAIGWLLGWLTIRSGSILSAIFSHNLINVLPALFWNWGILASIGIILKFEVR